MSHRSVRRKRGGEGVPNPVAAAVASAVFNAVGVRIMDLPISAEKILRGLRQKEVTSPAA